MGRAVLFDAKYPSKIFCGFWLPESGALRRTARLASHPLPFAKKFTFFFVRVLRNRIGHCLRIADHGQQQGQQQGTQGVTG